MFGYLNLKSESKAADNLDEISLEDIPDPPDMTCKAAVSMLTKRMLKGVAHCSKTMKFKNAKEKAAKSTVSLGYSSSLNIPQIENELY